jgi:hypothetical protein
MLVEGGDDEGEEIGSSSGRCLIPGDGDIDCRVWTPCSTRMIIWVWSRWKVHDKSAPTRIGSKNGFGGEGDCFPALGGLSPFRWQ